MEFGVELKLDNRQFSLLRAEVRSGIRLRRVESCLTKLLKRLDSINKGETSFPSDGFCFGVTSLQEYLP